MAVLDASATAGRAALQRAAAGGSALLQKPRPFSSAPQRMFALAHTWKGLGAC